MGSMAAHDCCANTAWTILRNGIYTLRALVPITMNENVTITYTEPTQGTLIRRQKLLESKYFECTCRRCSDPTELNSYFSAVKCGAHEDLAGNYFPLDPLSHSSAWKCDTCGDIKTVQWIQKVVKDIKEEIDELSGSEDSISSVEKLENMLQANSGIRVHENHFEMLRLENEILQRISYFMSLNNGSNITKNLSTKLADRMIQLSEKCLAVVDMIWPGYNRFRGMLFSYCIIAWFVLNDVIS